MTFNNNHTVQTLDEPQPLLIPDWSRMRLEAMHFERRADGISKCKMPGPRGWVDERTARLAWALFWRSVHKLDRSRAHYAEDLAATSDWSSRPDGERRAMGRCFKYFALQGVLPITLANPAAPYNFKYRLNDDLEQAPTAP